MSWCQQRLGYTAGYASDGLVVDCAMDALIHVNDWDRVERYASALEDYTREEPLAWTDFFIARGRALETFGRGKRDDATVQEIQRLRDEAKRLGLKDAMSALEEALSLI